MAFIPEGTRWAPVSASGNADKSYKLRCHEMMTPEKAYAYECWCQLPFETKEDYGDSDEDEDDDDSDGSLATDSETHGDEEVIEDERVKSNKVGGPLCNGGKTCLCRKPAKDHPDHPFITTAAARLRFQTQGDMISVRCPDNWEMHTFNDHEGLGAKEVLENLVLDFIEAEDNWREQWVVCETLALFLDDDLIESLMGIDDSVGVWQICHLVARTFLSMLSRLERLGLLSPTSEVRNLSLIMSLFMKLAADSHGEMHGLRAGETPRDQTVKLTLADGSTTTYRYSIKDFGSIIFLYFKKYAIPPTNL